jgi:hypothetical protein
LKIKAPVKTASKQLTQTQIGENKSDWEEVTDFLLKLLF